MKFCQPHWDALKEAVKVRGIWHLVAPDGKTAMKNILAELDSDGKVTEDAYDPLMAAHWGINSMALKIGGLYLMSMKEDGTHYCPLCEAEEHGGEGTAEKWINGQMDVIGEFCKSKGWVVKHEGTV